MWWCQSYLQKLYATILKKIEEITVMRGTCGTCAARGHKKSTKQVAKCLIFNPLESADKFLSRAQNRNNYLTNL